MSILICSSVKPATKVSPTVKSRKVVPTPKAARFAEVVNGRAAMQGMLWGSMNWAMSGENILQQVEDPMYALAATGVVTTLAAASLITVKDFDDEEFWSFTPEAELKNGRLAMLGFTTLLGLSAM
jgi:diacylglycerol kinase family enzyme